MPTDVESYSITHIAAINSPNYWLSLCSECLPFIVITQRGTNLLDTAIKCVRFAHSYSHCSKKLLAHRCLLTIQVAQFSAAEDLFFNLCWS